MLAVRRSGVRGKSRVGVVQTGSLTILSTTPITPVDYTVQTSKTRNSLTTMCYGG